MLMSSRFELRVDPFWRPLIVPLGGTDARSYAEITDDGKLRVRFGFLFDHAFPIASIASATGARPSWWAGIGWHTNFRGDVRLLGSHDGCVEVRFRDAVTVHMPLPARCQRLTISLKLPREFLAALAAAGVDTTSDSAAED
jgi:hypothetical protein